MRTWDRNVELQRREWASGEDWPTRSHYQFSGVPYHHLVGQMYDSARLGGSSSRSCPKTGSCSGSPTLLLASVHRVQSTAAREESDALTRRARADARSRPHVNRGQSPEQMSVTSMYPDQVVIPVASMTFTLTAWTPARSLLKSFSENCPLNVNSPGPSVDGGQVTAPPRIRTP